MKMDLTLEPLPWQAVDDDDGVPHVPDTVSCCVYLIRRRME